jgi:hypothetical protein
LNITWPPKWRKIEAAIDTSITGSSAAIRPSRRLAK